MRNKEKQGAILDWSRSEGKILKSEKWKLEDN
jgi:hypothetical protein